METIDIDVHTLFECPPPNFDNTRRRLVINCHSRLIDLNWSDAQKLAEWLERQVAPAGQTIVSEAYPTSVGMARFRFHSGTHSTFISVVKP